GAGGALVLGVVFNAGIMRSRIAKNQKVYPEVWIKERFLDLQNVFRSFDGSMYISVCMGLVENKSGMMYYINAEHPWTVLYRDGKASFIEEELSLRKLGTPEIEDRFFVRMFQLMPGDIVITGSDGRDDIAAIEDDPNHETINTDENQFLYRIEEADADLEGIFKAIQSKGYLIDDLSLLKIIFNPEAMDEEEWAQSPELPFNYGDTDKVLADGNAEQAIQSIEEVLRENPKFSDLLQVLGKLYYETGEYERAAECLNQFIELNPGANESVYLLSACYRNLNFMNEAADVGERLFLRSPGHFLNLVNLAEIYFALSVFTRADFMINRALELFPEDIYAKEIQVKIESSKSVPVATEAHKKPSSRNENRTIESILQNADKLYSKKNFRGALEEYKTVLKKDNENPWILFRAANCLSLLDKMDEAIEYYASSLSLAPKNYHARNNLGSIFYRLSRYAEARREWKIALEINPNFRTAQINLQRLEKHKNLNPETVKS
ncbi:MAG: tetratricopeptide repeat protein, partial [Leptospira sp.]|nr:tetratricopeptide repeat protein [Leptospira sp.]